MIHLGFNVINESLIAFQQIWHDNCRIFVALVLAIHIYYGFTVSEHLAYWFCDYVVSEKLDVQIRVEMFY